MFRYVAVDGAGERVTGEMEALDARTVVERLRSTGQFPLRAEEVKGAPSVWQVSLFGSGRPSLRELGVAMQELATLLQAGLPLDRALGTLAALPEVGRMRRVFGGALDRLKSGSGFADVSSLSRNVVLPLPAPPRWGEEIHSQALSRG